MLSLLKGRKYLVFLLLGVIILAAFFITNQFRNKTLAIEDYEILGNLITYDTYEELEEIAHLVIEVTATDDSKNVLTATDNGYTLTKVIVKHIVKEDKNNEMKKGEKIEVAEPFFLVDNDGKPVRYTYADYTPLEKGNHYLLFLWFDEKIGSYYIYGGYQGKYNLDSKDKKEKEKSDHNEHYRKLKQEVKTKHNEKK
ncbi:hypothetical protein [Caldalkalibacillus mannanilyticus]|uniref:hypothetical protein n=1 Tax=Caldalkalibacillus mannanilyticus TaxID=1418 RepID=UPI00046A54F7|nr:hypothetical protein [Caldalkalibacillus mannanilyticus]